MFKTSMMAATLVLAATAFAQNQSMPGMDMPAQPQPKSSTAPRKAHAGKQPTPAPQSDQSMPGMDMKGPQGSSMPGLKMDAPKQASPTMSGMDMSQHGSPSAGPPTGTGMQNMQGMHTDSPVTQAPQNGSVTHDTMNLQEPEDPAHKTGQNLPAPDLLKEVVGRAPMALQDFISLAEKSNPTLAEANLYMRRSAAQAKQAGLYPNPNVGYQGEQIRGGEYGGGEQGAFVQQTIVTAGKLGLRRNIYKQQMQSDQMGVEEQTYRVRNDVTQAFYATLTSQATVVVRQRLVGLAQDAVETVHQLANVGQADAPDILQAEVEAEQAKIDFVTAQRVFIQNFRVLASISGKRDLAVSPLAGSLDAPPELDAEQQVASIVASSPTVKRMQQEIAIGEARLKDARRESIPDVSLKAGEQYNFEQVAANPAKPAGPQSFATAGVNIPLWNRNQGNISAAQAEIERAKQDMVREQLSLKRMADPMAQSYLSSRFAADRYKTELIPRAQRAYDLYLTKYQSMAMAYPQVLVSQRTLFQLQIGYLSALHEVWSNAIALQNYTLSGALDRPMSSGSTATTINLPNATAGSPE